MYKEFGTNMKDEDMFLSTEDTYSSDVEMLGGEQSEEHIQSDTETIIVEEVKLMADDSLICMRTYMDIDPFEVNVLPSNYLRFILRFEVWISVRSQISRRSNIRLTVGTNP